jgi:TP901 family phage tail tape measure protein
MSGDLVVSLRIGGAINSSFTGTLRQVDGHLGQLGKTTERLNLQSLKLGDTLEESTQRPLNNLEKLRVGYERIAHVFDVLKEKSDNWSESLAQKRKDYRAEAFSVLKNTAITSAPLIKSVMSAANFQDTLRDISITGGFSASQENNLGSVIRKSALDWNQTQEEIANGIGVLVAGGINDANALESYAPKLAKISTATRASMEDLGSVAISLKDSLGITAAGFDRSMNMLAFAGKQGQFELKDMAKWLPSLAPSFASLGVKGEEAVAEIGAALQIARKGAGSNDEAANNFRNFLGKLTSEDTKKSFADAGIDIKQSMLNLRAKGFTPVMSMLNVVQDYMTKKSPEAAKSFKQVMSIKDDNEREQALNRLSEAYKLGELFSDMQAMNFIRPAIANMKELNSINADSTTAANQDVIGKDFNWRMGSPVEQFKFLQISIGDLAIELGNTLLPIALELLETIKPMISEFSLWIKQNPELVRGIANAAIFLLKFKLGILGIKYTLNLMLSPIAAFLGSITKLSVGVFLLIKGLKLFGISFSPIRIFGNALLWLGRQAIPLLLRGLAGLMFNPWTLGIVAAGLLIYQVWQPIKAFLGGVFDGISNGLAPLGAAFSNTFAQGAELLNVIGTLLGQVFNWVVALITPLDSSSESLSKWANAGQLIGDILIGTLTHIVNLIGFAISGYTQFLELFSSESDTPKLELSQQTKNEVMTKLLPSLPKQPETFSEDMTQRLAATNQSNRILAQQSLAPAVSNSHTIHMTQNITISPQAASTPEQINQAMAMSQRDFEKMLDRYFADRQRRAF